MIRYVLEVMYDGTCFHGSQVQGDVPTVQLAINKMLATLFRSPVASFGASRTDEGVHALSNFYHFDAADELQFDLLYKGNAILPDGVAITKLYTAGPDFNARFDAIRRKYRYRIYASKDPFLLNRALFYPYKLQKSVLDETAAVIKENTQFESFSKRNTQTKTFNCKILESYWEEKEGELHYVVTANRFLRGMVRGLVGTQLHIARTKGDANDIREIFEAHDCKKAFFNVAGHGLYLEEIIYPDGAITEARKFFS
jgi:tRNA pseudouridine38-40 synthase